jgi:predicted acetyltransferase
VGGLVSLVVRPLGLGDEAEALAAHAELVAEGSMFLLGHDTGEDWAGFLARVERHRAGTDLPDGHVTSTFLVGEADHVLVGMLVVRHRLSPRLERMGGHLGYAVRPAHRRRGYATALMRDGLDLAGRLGLEQVLVTCSDDNAPSITIIEGAGGVLQDRIEVLGHGTRRRYRVPTTRSL